MSLVADARVNVDAVESLVSRMTHDYDVAPAVVRAYATAMFDRFADSRVQAFVPLLVERHVRDWLRQSKALAAALSE